MECSVQPGVECTRSELSVLTLLECCDRSVFSLVVAASCSVSQDGGVKCAARDGRG